MPFAARAQCYSSGGTILTCCLTSCSGVYASLDPAVDAAQFCVAFGGGVDNAGTPVGTTPSPSTLLFGVPPTGGSCSPGFFNQPVRFLFPWLYGCDGLRSPGFFNQPVRFPLPVLATGFVCPVSPTNVRYVPRCSFFATGFVCPVSSTGASFSGSLGSRQVKVRLSTTRLEERTARHPRMNHDEGRPLTLCDFTGRSCFGP